MLTFKRGKRRYNADFSIQDIYSFYTTKCENPVPSNVHKSVLKKFHQGWFTLAITTGMELHFPFRLGSLRVRKKKKRTKLTPDGKLDRSNLAVNWVETKKMWVEKYPDLTPEQIAEIPVTEKGFKYNYNDHTEKYTFRFYWDKITCNIPNKSWYSFKPIRDFKTQLARELKTNNKTQYLFLE